MKHEGIKTLFDLIGSVFLIIVFFPVMLVAAICVAGDGTGGSILLERPLRLGRNGKPFRMFKFRTMIPDGDEQLMKKRENRHLNEKLKTIRKLTIDEDPRITAIGRVLRKTDIDELPQLFNVLSGTMSLVGPRPYLEDELEYSHRCISNGIVIMNKALSVLPGMTGLWQVSGRNDIDFEHRIKIDAEYAEHRTFWTDLSILLRTPIVVVTRKGAW